MLRTGPPTIKLWPRLYKRIDQFEKESIVFILKLNNIVFILFAYSDSFKSTENWNM